MADTAVDLSSFFELPELNPETYESLADQVYANSTNRDRFDLLTREYARKVEAGEGEPLRLALALLLLGRCSEALEWFAKSPDNRMRRYYSARAALGLGRYDEAIKFFEQAESRGWDAFECQMARAAAHIRKGELDAAEQLIKANKRTGQDRAEWYYVRGLLAEQQHLREQALEEYTKALTLDPQHEQAMFRAAWLHDIAGDDAQAIELYQKLASRPRSKVNALINLAVIYEDTGRFDEAEQCLRRVLAVFPNHRRARLFLKDVVSSREMVIDDSLERLREARERLLRTPISEFELSVRARNCLKKMNIHTLGDLLKLTESELLSYKNFGESSLNEIKAVLARRGLKLGMSIDEIDPAAVAQAHAQAAPKVTVPPGREAVLNKPVSELELSVRARRCLQRLNIATVGDLIQHTEQDLLSTRNFGQTSLNEVKARLAELGLTLASKA